MRTENERPLWTHVRIQARLELCNLFGLNVFRYTKEKKAKRKSAGMAALSILLIAMAACYVGGLSFGLIYLGLEAAVLPYLITISSIIIMFFGMLKAGSVIFRREGYDMLCALPVPRLAVVAGRMFRMYVENLLMSLVVLLPGIVVYAWKLRPGAGFYGMLLLTIWSVPLLPMTLAIFIGALITGVSSRMRHKNLVMTGLSIFIVLAMLYGSSRLASMGTAIDMEHMIGMENGIAIGQIKGLSEMILAVLGKVYPPAVWYGEAVSGVAIWQGVICVFVSLSVFAAVALVVSRFFHQICQHLYGNVAKHNYVMGAQKENSVLVTLCKREFKRYVSSSVYVTNTIIGPIMGCVLSGAMLVAGPDSLEEFLPIPMDVGALMPFVVAAAFCMMTTTATSISMEGKNWWIVKSLPLSMKQILDAKIGMNLLLFLPFYFVSEILLMFALKPRLGEFVWMILIPMVLILFSCVYGITINLHFPVMTWDNEVSVVKQSTSALLGMGGALLAILCAVGVCVAPEGYAGSVKAGMCVVILAVTAVLYRKNNRWKLS